MDSYLNEEVKSLVELKYGPLNRIDEEFLETLPDKVIDQCIEELCFTYQIPAAEQPIQENRRLLLSLTLRNEEHQDMLRQILYRYHSV